MKFNINPFKKKEARQEERGYNFLSDSLFYNSATTYSESKAMLLSAVYRCVDVISDSVAQLPLEPYYVDDEGFKTKFTKHPTYWLLNREPNDQMSRFTFIKTLVTSVLLTGNGYALINRDEKGDAKELIFLKSDSVSVTFKNGKKMYNITGMNQLVEAINMIHILNFSYDGITGISTLKHARNTLGLTSLTAQQKQDIKTAWSSAFNSITGTPNGVAVMEGNMTFQPITVNPSDAQLLETRQFNVIDICRFFGVSPVKAFDLSKSSYSTVEATQLAFLTDTLSPLLEKIELEFERKLYKPSERNNIDVRFDTSVLLRADKASLASYYNTLFQIGVITPNEIRKNLDLPAIENGDKSFVQVNVQTLDNAVTKQTEKDEEVYN